MSTIIASNVSDGTLSIPTTTVVNGSAKAWVNFDGTGTVAIRESANVASITDRGTGLYTVNLTTAMSDTDYNIVSHVHENTAASGGYNRGINGYPLSTSAFYINTSVISTNSLIDCGFVCASIFR